MAPAPCGGPLGDVIQFLPLSSIPTFRPDALDMVAPEPRVGRSPPTIPGSSESVDVARQLSGSHQDSMNRTRCGDIPAVRTGLTVTLPALPDASSILPPPRKMV